MARPIVYQAQVKITGVTPLLMNKCGMIGKNVTDPTTDYSDEWVATTYLNQAQDHVAIPSMNLEAMMRDAATSHKIGKNAMNKMVVTGVLVDEFEIPVYGPCNKLINIEKIRENKWTFSCPVVISKSRVVKTRTCLPPGWNMTFNLLVSNPLLKSNIVEDLITRAGYETGLCDWRPFKKGKFGQFEVEKFEVTK